MKYIMEGNFSVENTQEQLNIREQNKRFDRRLIISYLNSNKPNYLRRDNKDFYKIIINLIEKKLLHVHCSNINQENLSLLKKKTV